MNANAKPSQIQHQRIQQHARLDALEFFILLTSPDLFDVLEQHPPIHRERRYPPTETLSMFLSQAMNADRSCQNIVNVSAVKRVVEGLPHYNIYTGSYCKARRRLPTDIVNALVKHTGK